MHIDGFRFDLAAVLTRGEDGQVLVNSPAVNSIEVDPVLADTKLIAEAWDAAGLYQLGFFAGRNGGYALGGMERRLPRRHTQVYPF